MQLKNLLQNVCHLPWPPSVAEMDVSAVYADSRQVTEGSIFFALKGPSGHGADHIVEAIQKGAKIIVGDRISPVIKQNPQVHFLEVPDPRRCFEECVGVFYGHPSRQIKTVGITGTNGKTTITYLLEAIFQNAQKTCGVIGTVNHRYNGKIFPSHNTTPGIIENYRYLSEMIRDRVEYCFMEVSSHALDQRRVAGIDFKTAVFTNLTSDHMDYHKNREAYFQAKARLFTHQPPEHLALINKDDSYGHHLTAVTSCRIHTYGMNNPSDIFAENVRFSLQGSSFTLVTSRGKEQVCTSLIGRHNIYNILAAVGVAFEEGIDWPHIQTAIEQFTVVPGRLERIEGGRDFFTFVDYAHTEDALQNVLKSLREISQGKVIVVFGCGGDRDRTKRPRMGQVACQLADMAIVTSDNPRSEDPYAITEQIVGGFSKDNYRVILDRRQAIKEGLRLAGRGDVVLIAGKGHENYQIFRDKTIDFDEREVVKECLRDLMK